jgi:hypothetical protein
MLYKPLKNSRTASDGQNTGSTKESLITSIKAE